MIGSITITAETFISKRVVEDHPKVAEKHAREDLKELIARRIYDDQRRELYEALDEFIRSHYPMMGVDGFASAERLLKAARYQESQSPAEKG